MRAFFALVLVPILFLNFFGFYISFFLNRENIKAEAEKSIMATKRNSLERFEFTCNEFSQLQRPDGNNKEVIINNLMYDIKSTESLNGKVIVLAKKDTSETNLLKTFLAEIDHQSSSSQSDNSRWLIKMLQQEFVSASSLPAFNLKESSVYFASQSFSLTSHSSDRLTPPPDGLIS